VIFKNIFRNKVGKKLALFAQTTASFSKKMIIILVFEENAILLPKIGKDRRKL
jgi:hypothetical protein